MTFILFRSNGMQTQFAEPMLSCRLHGACKTGIMPIAAFAAMAGLLAVRNSHTCALDGVHILAKHILH